MQSGQPEAFYAGGADHEETRVALVVTRWNAPILDRLYGGAVATLEQAGVGRIARFEVPGAFELTLAAKMLARRYDAVVCLGCVIKGETRHDQYIAQAVANGLTQVSAETEVPVVFGVLTVENEAQALARSGGEKGNKGADCAVAALQMLDFVREAS